ncbi:hypothetical protein WJX72_003822 [[Myrmecia] bisecta]|uniref:Oxysterol-binding protein n=1 Tax=[Myrmecia] bisecta TaxID=41462 RepID=A0AAW1Q6E0_9CHLO
MADGGGGGQQAAPAAGGVMGTLASWGGGMWNYTTSTLNSLMGFEDLDVVNPDSGQAEHGSTSDVQQLQGVDEAERQKAFTNYRDYIGMDITSLVTLPVWIMEPFSILQTMAQIMEYNEALDKASACEDPYERLAWVVGFCVGTYGSLERTWKPFNPILGETFELELENGTKFFSEQVSHHPPIGAGHGENTNWTYDIVSAPSTKFLGNSVEIYPVGRSRIKLRKTGEEFSLVPPNTKANNVVIGRTWIDTAGEFTVLNCTSGAKCSLYFTPCGWFGSGRYEVSGHIYTEEGRKVLALAGKWNSHLDMVKCDAEGDPLPGAETVRLWTCKPKPTDDKYGFTYFARMLNSCKGINPMPSDSRRRPDRAALEAGDNATAGAEKYALEEMQRAERREREKRGDAWQPRWFRPNSDAKIYPIEYPPDQCPLWEFNGEALKREKRPAKPDDDFAGIDFCPWQYPEIHQYDDGTPDG